VARPTSDDKGKVKFKIIEGRTIEFELEEFNSTIEESIKNIVTSLGRNNFGSRPFFSLLRAALPGLPSRLRRFW